MIEKFSKSYKSLKEQLECSNNPEFWLAKIQRNIERDREVNAELHGLGWHVIRFWSNEVLKHPDECLKAIEEIIFQHITADSS